jgi:hypothetical protein
MYLLLFALSSSSIESTGTVFHLGFVVDTEPDPDPHHFEDDKPKCMEFESILALFQGFEHLW